MKNGRNMFCFLDNPLARLMIDMSKERYTKGEIQQLLERFSKINQEAFMELCCEHEFEGMVASFLEKYATVVPDEWDAVYHKCHKRAVEKLEEAKKICERMYNAGIDMILLKNGGILADIIDDPAKMPMGDIDTVVRRKDFLKAYDIMIDNGYVFEYSNEYEIQDINNAYRDGDAEYYKEIAPNHTLCCEIAWRIVAGRWMRPDKEPVTEDNFDRMHFARNSKIGILSPEDNLLQVCIHTAKHSYLRAPGIRLNLDVERIVSNSKIDWEVFLDRVKKAHTKTAVYYSLYISYVLFNTQIPDYVFDEILPSKQKRVRIENMLEKAGFLHPKQRKFGRFSYLLFQTSLYDSMEDMYRTIYPSSSWLKQRYKFASSFLVPYYIIIRVLDLMGIRKKQK